MVFGAFAAIFGAGCGKRRPTQVDCGAPRPIYHSPPLWTSKTNKIRLTARTDIGGSLWTNLMAKCREICQELCETTQN